MNTRYKKHLEAFKNTVVSVVSSAGYYQKSYKKITTQCN